MKTFDWPALNRRAAEEYLATVRPGVPGKAPFWNVASGQFTYVPAFDIEEVPGAARYRIQITELVTGKVSSVIQEKPWAPVVELWRSLPATAVRLEAFALDDKDNVIKQANIGGVPSREFCRRPGFHGPYSPAVKDYRECALLSLKHVLSFCKASKLAETGKADPAAYGYFCYPNKMLDALTRGLCRYAAEVPAEREDALRMARTTADILIQMSVPEGAPLAHLPLTYKGDGNAAKGKNDLIQMTEPITATIAYLDLYDATKEEKYREAAFKIAETYNRLQQPDGSWFLKYNWQTGQPTTSNKLNGAAFLPLSHRLESIGFAPAKAMREKMLSWIMAEVIAPFNWEAQFEDTSPLTNYRNLSNYQAVWLASYLIGQRADHPEYQPLAEAIIRFGEDQFVLWGPCTVPEEKAKDWNASVMAGWRLPLAQEQYDWMKGINASAAVFISGWSALYKATGDELWLAKACALGDVMTQTQLPTGELPTYWSVNGELQSDNWINCEVWSALAMLDLAEARKAWAGR